LPPFLGAKKLWKDFVSTQVGLCLKDSHPVPQLPKRNEINHSFWLNPCQNGGRKAGLHKGQLLAVMSVGSE
jgi:hypothetical protein